MTGRRKVEPRKVTSLTKMFQVWGGLLVIVIYVGDHGSFASPAAHILILVTVTAGLVEAIPARPWRGPARRRKVLR